MRLSSSSTQDTETISREESKSGRQKCLGKILIKTDRKYPRSKRWAARRQVGYFTVMLKKIKKGIQDMDEKVKSQVTSYINSVNSFLNEVDSWIKSPVLTSNRQEIEISEEGSGTYKVSKLTLQDESKKTIAEFIPVGTFIIGGNGRIDLNGTIDKAIIVNLEAGGPSMTKTATVGNYSETSKTAFYKGIGKQGWYWIEDRRRGKAIFFDKDLFYELLREVSDYELG